MLCGSCDSYGFYVWGGFDFMCVLCRKYNYELVVVFRFMSESVVGFVFGSGVGVLVLEELDYVFERGVIIYVEIIGGYMNFGGYW